MKSEFLEGRQQQERVARGAGQVIHKDDVERSAQPPLDRVQAGPILLAQAARSAPI
jgi:hypothetical protein